MSARPVPSGALPVSLASAFDSVRFAQSVGMEPDSWQGDVLRSPATRMLLNCSRQSGKSTTAAVLALHKAVHHAGSLVLVVSPSLRQSSELFRVISRLHGRLGTPANAANLHEMQLANGSRILSLPGSEATIRGHSGVSLLILDEAARVPDELFFATMPMLATTGGTLVAMSTPFGRRGWFSDAWHGPNEWKRVKIPATEVPRISPAFLAEQRRTMGAYWFDQEYMCSFEDADVSAFRSEDLDRARRPVERWAL